MYFSAIYIYSTDIAGRSSALGLQSEYSGENGDVQPLYAIITVCAAAQHCCKGDERFQWEMPFFRVFQLRNPWTDFQNFCTVDYDGNPTPTLKFASVSPKGCVCACVKLSSSGIYFSFFFRFFSFMRIATGLPIGPIIVVNGLNDAFWWHSHFLYGLVKKNWNFPPLAPKILKFALRPMATLKSHNSDTVKHTCEMFAPNREFSVSGNQI